MKEDERGVSMEKIGFIVGFFRGQIDSGIAGRIKRKHSIAKNTIYRLS